MESASTVIITALAEKALNLYPPLAHRRLWSPAAHRDRISAAEQDERGPVITDNGNFVMDVDFGTIDEPAALAARLCGIPGMVEHGIFDNTDELYLARAGTVEIIRRR